MLHETAWAFRLIPHKDGKGFWPFLKHFLDRQLNVDHRCVHGPKDTWSQGSCLCASANNSYFHLNKKHARGVLLTVHSRPVTAPTLPRFVRARADRV